MKLAKYICFATVFTISLAFYLDGSYESYNQIMYGFPTRGFYMLLMILFILINTVFIFLYLIDYLNTRTFVITRIGKHAYHTLMAKRIVTFLIVMFAFHACIDLLIFQKTEIILNLINSLSCLLVVPFLSIRKLKEYDFVVTFGILLCLRFLCMTLFF